MTLRLAMPLCLTVTIERFPIAGTFTISRGSRTEAVVVVAVLTSGAHTGRGECVPYARYGETVAGVVAQIEAQAAALAKGMDRQALQSVMPAGAARNAIDCALWDLEAKRSGIPACVTAGFAALAPVTTCYTLSLGTPASMAAAALAARARPLLKLKLGGAGDADRLAAIRAAVPHARLVADANEAWDPTTFAANIAACATHNIELIEQPLPASADSGIVPLMGQHHGRIPLCADESLHDRASLRPVAAKYGAINIKLDKTGGLTEALLLAAEARRTGLDIMVGCMVGTSLAMAPAMILAQAARWVDLDGPLLLARDRSPGLRYDGSTVHPPGRELWG
jgi:L-Ala-D/L-Glu epimerase